MQFCIDILFQQFRQLNSCHALRSHSPQPISQWVVVWFGVLDWWGRSLITPFTPSIRGFYTGPPTSGWANNHWISRGLFPIFHPYPPSLGKALRVAFETNAGLWVCNPSRKYDCWHPNPKQGGDRKLKPWTGTTYVLDWDDPPLWKTIMYSWRTGLADTISQVFLIIPRCLLNQGNHLYKVIMCSQPLLKHLKTIS